jgi:hypothetical protein
MRRWARQSANSLEAEYFFTNTGGTGILYQLREILELNLRASLLPKLREVSELLGASLGASRPDDAFSE